MKTTVMMVVHNGEKYLEACMKSILAQTYHDYELLIVDDGSTDMTRSIICSFNDTRIRLIENTHDYIASLNIGLEEAKGELIARMDADDLMMPERLARQVELMENRKEVVVCASWVMAFGQQSGLIAMNKGLISCPEAALLRGNVFCHNTIMLRKSFLVGNSLSYKKYDYAEDYKLWCDIAGQGGLFYVIPEVLVRFRKSTDQISFRKMKEQMETAGRIRNEMLERLLYGEEYTFPRREKLVKLAEYLCELNQQRLVSGAAVRGTVALLYEDMKKGNFI